MIMRPQIMTSRNVLTSFVAPVGTRIGAMIGTAQWGEINQVTSITSMSEFVSTFGNDVSGTSLTLIKGADLFFRNGGSLKVVRIVDGNEAKSDLMLVSGATDMINIIGKYNGTYGDNITVTVEAIGTARSVSITDGVTTEYYSNNGTGFSNNTDIAAAINASSSLVTAVVESGQGANLIDVSSAAQLTGGNDGAASLTATEFTDAMDDLLLTEEYNFLLIPGETDDSFHSTVAGKLETRESSEKKYSRFISGIAVDETITTALARTASSKRLSVLAPSVKYTHRATGSDINLDASYTACAYAGLLCKLDLQVSGTHETVSVNSLIINTTSGKQYYNKVEQEQLLNGGIAPMALIGNAIQMVRAITSFSDQTSVWVEEVVVDIVDEVVRRCEDYLNTVIGKPNTEARRAIYAASLDAILSTLQSQEVIQEFNPSQVLEGSSSDTITAKIAIKPTYNTNFVMLSLDVN